MVEAFVLVTRFPGSEGWTINTYHQPYRDCMEVRLSHRDGRERTLILTDEELHGDLDACQRKLFDWVAETTGASVMKTRQIELD